MDAWVYPIGLVMLEADLVVERENQQQASALLGWQLVVSTIPNMGGKPESTKSMIKAFRELIDRLLGD